MTVSAISEMARSDMTIGGGNSTVTQLQVGRLTLRLGSPDGAALLPAAEGPLAQPRVGPILLRPRPVASLVGRGPTVAAVLHAVGAARPALLCGAPGMGKTALLSQLAYQVPRSWCPDGAIYLHARYADLSDLLQALYDLFYQVVPAYKPLPDELIAGLQNRQALLLLDDGSLLPEAWTNLMQALPGWRFVLAAAQPQAIGDAYIHCLDGLSSDDALTLVERELGHWVSSSEKPAVQQACASLQGNPLLLLQMVTLAGKQQRPLLELVADLPPERASEPLQEQILASLTEPERRILAALAGADGVRLSLSTLGDVTDLPQVGPILENLQRQYLVDAKGHLYQARRPLVVAFRQSSDTTPWLWRVLSNVLGTVEGDYASPVGEDEMLSDVPRLCAAATKVGWWAEAIRLARAAESYLAQSRRWGAWEAVLNHALQASRVTSDRATEAWALHQLGTRMLCLGDERQGHILLKRSLSLQRRPTGKALTRNNLAYSRANAGAYHTSPASADQPVPSPGRGLDALIRHRLGRVAFRLSPWLAVGAISLIAIMLVLWGLRTPGFARSPTGRPAEVTPSRVTNAAAIQTPVSAQPSPLPTSPATSQPTTAVASPTAMATPSPVPTMTPEPTVAPTLAPVVVYDFVASASRARWRNSAQQVLSFPSRGATALGLVCPFQDLLEDGRSATAGLETRPNLIRQGFLRGYYRQSVAVESGDCFYSSVGFRQGAEGGQVTFRVSFDSGCNGTYDARWELQKAYDGHLAEWAIPLDILFAGGDKPATGCFALQVDAGESSRNDHAVWVEARIERP
jgi:hypothetical protein